MSYSVGVSPEGNETQKSRVGLCIACRYVRRITSDRGSTFYLCDYSSVDPHFPKYPRLPVIHCSAYNPLPETTT